MSDHLAEIIAEADRLAGIGLSWVPITKGHHQDESGQWVRDEHCGKRPTIVGWQRIEFNRSVANGWFTDADSKLGIVLGPRSRNLVCVDLDHPSAVRLAGQYLPPTGVIIGRTGNERCHWFYVLADGDETAKQRWFHLSSKTLFIELLATGQQVVVGPSTHPNGGVYHRFTGVPAVIGVQDIKAACQRLFEACLSELGLESDAAPPQGRSFFLSSSLAKREEKNDPTLSPRAAWAAQRHTVLSVMRLRGATIYDDISTDDCVYVRCPGISTHKHENKHTDCKVERFGNGQWGANCFHESCGINSWESLKAALPIPRRTPAVDLSGLLNRGAK